MKVSIVIRTLNEADKLRRLLDSLGKQKTNHQLELIVVDNESTDETQEIARHAGAKVVVIKDFTYPKSMNLGCSHATGEIIILTVGHAVPFSDTWIDDGLKHFNNQNVAGVYANTWYDADATWIEKILYGLTYYFMKLRGVSRVTKPAMGVFGATNCALRRSLWQQKPFDESYERGGEDTAWAHWAIQQGFDIIRDQAFAVCHSHGTSLRAWIQQYKYWNSLGPNQQFNPEELLSFRKDLKDRLK